MVVHTGKVTITLYHPYHTITLYHHTTIALYHCTAIPPPRNSKNGFPWEFLCPAWSQDMNMLLLAVINIGHCTRIHQIGLYPVSDRAAPDQAVPDKSAPDISLLDMSVSYISVPHFKLLC